MFINKNWPPYINNDDIRRLPSLLHTSAAIVHTHGIMSHMCVSVPAYGLFNFCLDELDKEQCSNQRWASTLANRLNARHRSNIRAPPPQMHVSKVWEYVARRGRKRFIASWGQDVTYLSLHPMPPPPPLPKGYKSNVESRPFAHLW
jgi:hypothetical protein